MWQQLIEMIEWLTVNVEYAKYISVATLGLLSVCLILGFVTNGLIGTSEWFTTGVGRAVALSIRVLLTLLTVASLFCCIASDVGLVRAGLRNTALWGTYTHRITNIIFTPLLATPIAYADVGLIWGLADRPWFMRTIKRWVPAKRR